MALSWSPSRNESRLLKMSVLLASQRQAETTSQYSDFACKAKRHINGTLIPECLASGRDNGGAIIVLDGAMMQTSKSLVHSSGYAGKRIHIVEWDAKTKKHMQACILRHAISSHNQFGHVHVHGADLFAFLHSKDAPSCIFAIIADGMQRDYTAEQYTALAKAAASKNVQHLFITFSCRGAANSTIAKRMHRLQHGPVGAIFRGIRVAFGYKRHESGQSMMFVAMQRRPYADTLYRPLSVQDKTQDGKYVLTKWAGWPDKKDWTWEPVSEIIIDDE